MSGQVIVFDLLPADDYDLLLAALAKQNESSFAQQQTLTSGVVNSVQVVVADQAAITAPTTTDLQSVTASVPASITDFGEASAQLVVIADNSVNPSTGVTFAEDLASYLIRDIPEYWFSNIEILLNGLTEAQRDVVVLLDIGDQITVSKRFPNVANPVVEKLFVEGIDHRITPSNHTVILQCSPAVVVTLFILNTSVLDDVDVGLG